MSKTAKARETFAVIATALPVLGAVGTVFVWLSANFYVGDVEIVTDKPFNGLTVKAFDKKGQEATFHTPRFQLMPGQYHLEIIPDGCKTEHADTVVEFRKKELIKVAVRNGSEPNDQNDHNGPDQANSPTDRQEDGKKKKWWQVWRKN